MNNSTQFSYINIPIWYGNASNIHKYFRSYNYVFTYAGVLGEAFQKFAQHASFSQNQTMAYLWY